MGVQLLLEKVKVEGIRHYDVYRREGGYRSVEKALKQMSPEAIVEEVKKSGLRGRGGAGFPATLYAMPMKVNPAHSKTATSWNSSPIS